MDVLYEDAHILVVNKPAMLSTQAPPIAGPTLETAVRAHLRQEPAAAVYVGTVHRLDRPVSGVILWAKNPKSARRLAQQFARKRVEKRYWAIVEGQPARAEGIWEDWLCHDRTGLGRVQAVAPGTPRAQSARTRFRHRVAPALPPDWSWLELAPETGRTHQLRVQAASRGMPVLGDRLYGAAADFPEGIALHARSLTIAHPVLERPMSFVAPVPSAWEAAGVRIAGS